MQMMQLNVTTDYAIRTVLYLAIKDELATSNEIAMAMGIPPSYVLKITSKLVVAGIIKRIVGAQGGFLLAKKPTEISLYEIINVRLQSLTVVWRPAGIAAVLLLKIVRYGPFTVSYRA